MFKKCLNQIKNFFINRRIIKLSNSKIEKSTLRHAKLEGYNIVKKNSKIFYSSIGLMTYVGNNCTIIKTKIGKYCSISSNFNIVGGSHPVDSFVSTHPLFYDKYPQYNLKTNNTYDEYKTIENNG